MKHASHALQSIRCHLVDIQAQGSHDSKTKLAELSDRLCDASFYATRAIREVDDLLQLSTVEVSRRPSTSETVDTFKLVGPLAAAIVNDVQTVHEMALALAASDLPLNDAARGAALLFSFGFGSPDIARLHARAIEGAEAIRERAAEMRRLAA